MIFRLFAKGHFFCVKPNKTFNIGLLKLDIYVYLLVPMLGDGYDIFMHCKTQQYNCGEYSGGVTTKGIRGRDLYVSVCGNA